MGDLMSTRYFTRWALGSGIAVALCAATLPAQVDTTRRDTTRAGARSTTRIPIRKESRGEVVMPTTTRARTDSLRADSLRLAVQSRTDSINNANLIRNDSIAAAERARSDSMSMRTRQDSIAMAARTDSISRAEQMRTDSMSRTEQARTDSMSRVNTVPTVDQNFPQAGTRRLPGSFYIGLAAGAASPTGDVEDLGYDSGMNISIPIGWHNPASLFGFRLMLNYNQFNGGPFTTGGTSPVVLSNPDPKVYSAELNLNMRFPFNARKTSSLYLVGGGGLYMFRNFGQGSALGAYLGNDVLDPEDSANESTINKWGVNGGAGLEFGIGTSSIFLESRLVNVFAGRDDEPTFDSILGERGTSVRWVPLILGFTIR
jgi:hypothetical protein